MTTRTKKSIAQSKSARSKQTMTPTSIAYEGFDRAFEYFNSVLFGGTLPACIITMQRHPKSLAYFSGGRFTRAHQKGDGKRKDHDEIAMNPLHMEERRPAEILSTLVHEMCHSWQHHHGKPPTRCYHDREWAAKMREVGLQPSHTGLPGGKETGPQMTHYILPDGPFARTAETFLKANKVEFYQDRARALAGVRAKRKTKGVDDEEAGGEDEAPKSTGRAKFTCPGCQLNAWAKPSARIECMDCSRPLVSAEED